MTHDQVADLRSLRTMLQTRSISSEGWLAAMYANMVAVMDNHLGVKRAGSGRRELALDKKNIRQFHRDVSRTINVVYGVKLPYR